MSRVGATLPGVPVRTKGICHCGESCFGGDILSLSVLLTGCEEAGATLEGHPWGGRVGGGGSTGNTG